MLFFNKSLIVSRHYPPDAISAPPSVCGCVFSTLTLIIFLDKTVPSVRARIIHKSGDQNVKFILQAFSVDGGKTWETNWITEQTKEKP